MQSLSQLFRLFLLLPLLCTSLNVHAQLQTWGEYPPIPRIETEILPLNLHGVSQIDPLRGLERLDDASVQAWIRKQNDLSQQLLGRMQGVNDLSSRLRDLNRSALNKTSISQNSMSQTVSTNLPLKAVTRSSGYPKNQRLEFQTPENLFYTDVGLDQQTRLLMRNQMVGNERVVYLGARGESIGQILASPDKKKIAILLAQGDAGMTIRIVRSGDGELLRDGVNALPMGNWADFSMVWSGDSNSLLYSRNLQASIFRKSEIWMHGIEQPDKFDRPVIAVDVRNAASQLLKLTSSDSPKLTSIAGTSLVLLTISQEDDHAKRYFYISQSELKGAATAWRSIALPSDKAQTLLQAGNKLFLLSTKKSQNGEILKVDLSASTTQLQLPQFKELVKSGQAQIKEIATTKSSLYWSSDINGIGKLFKLDVTTNTREEVALPLFGKVSQLQADMNTDSVVFNIAASNMTLGRYSVDSQGKVAVITESKPLKSEPLAEKNLVQKKSLMIPAADGGMITVSVNVEPGLVLDRQRPVLLRVLKSGSVAEDVLLQAWVEQHGVVVDMPLRTTLDKKNSKVPDAAADVLSVARYLMKENYAGSGMLAAEELTDSNNALIKAVLKQPDLFAAISLHNVASETIPTTLHQKMRDPTIKSAYEDLRAGVAYPAMLITADEQSKVPPMWMSAKLAAGLQILNADKSKPVLLGTLPPNATEEEIALHTAKRWGFFLYQMGQRGFALQSQKILAK